MDNCRVNYELAACRGKPFRWWFPTTHGRFDSYKYARSVCSRCPVRSDCLETCMKNEGAGWQVRFGMYGGLSPAERDELYKRRVAS